LFSRTELWAHGCPNKDYTSQPSLQWKVAIQLNSGQWDVSRSVPSPGGWNMAPSWTTRWRNKIPETRISDPIVQPILT